MNDYTSSKDEEFFGAIGRLTISWAHLELGIDAFVEILYHLYDGKSIDAEIPRALGRKLTFLRAAVRRIPVPEESIQGYLSMLDHIKAASELRHDIIHGVVIEHAERSGEAKLVRVVRTRDGTTKRQIEITTRSVLEAAVETNRMGGKLLAAVNGIYDLLHELRLRRDEQKPS